jgi:hypothetical protein
MPEPGLKLSLMLREYPLHARINALVASVTAEADDTAIGDAIVALVKAIVILSRNLKRQQTTRAAQLLADVTAGLRRRALIEYGLAPFPLKEICKGKV